MQIPPLYHWSSTGRRESILEHGLKPGSMHTIQQPRRKPLAICLSSSPNLAWSLSGGIFGYLSPKWDLWQVTLDDADEVHVEPCWGAQIQEVRVANRIPSDRVWWVGERTP